MLTAHPTDYTSFGSRLSRARFVYFRTRNLLRVQQRTWSNHSVRLRFYSAHKRFHSLPCSLVGKRCIRSSNLESVQISSSPESSDFEKILDSVLSDQTCSSSQMMMKYWMMLEKEMDCGSISLSLNSSRRITVSDTMLQSFHVNVLIVHQPVTHSRCSASYPRRSSCYFLNA